MSIRGAACSPIGRDARRCLQSPPATSRRTSHASHRIDLQGLRHSRRRRQDARRDASPSTWAARSAPRRCGRREARSRSAATGACRARRWSAALIRGLASTGLDVVDIGAVTTPMLYYVAATRGEHGCNSGIQVTGSHNPKDYNGFKMVLAGRAIYGDEIQGLRRRIEAEDYAQGDGPHRRRWTSCAEYSAPHRERLQARAADEDRRRLRQRHSRRVGARHPARARLRGGRAVLRGRRRLPEPPSRPEQAGEPGRPDPHRADDRRRARPRVRRRRRPPRRRHQGRPDHLPRPAADAVRDRRAQAQAAARRSSTTSSARSASRRRSAKPAASR